MSVMSVGRASAVPLSFWMSRTNGSSEAEERANSTTGYPRAKRRAMAAPVPGPAPAMIAIVFGVVGDIGGWFG